MNMNFSHATRSQEGSHEAQVALLSLARTLNINPNVLKIALNGAFDLLGIAGGNPMLALHLSFNRLNYRIDSNVLNRIIGAFRQAFGALLSGQRNQAAVVQTSPMQHHGYVSGVSRIPGHGDVVQSLGYNTMGRQIHPTSTCYTTTGPFNRHVGSPLSFEQYQEALGQSTTQGYSRKVDGEPK